MVTRGGGGGTDGSNHAAAGASDEAQNRAQAPVKTGPPAMRAEGTKAQAEAEMPRAVAEATLSIERNGAGPERGANSASSKVGPVARASSTAEAGDLAQGREQRTMRTKETSLLVDAARDGSEARVKSLLDGGATLEDRDADGDTALLKAVRQRHFDVAALLLRRGADRMARGRDGQSAQGLAESSEEERMRALFSR